MTAADTLNSEHFNDTAVYWAPAGLDAYGMPTFDLEVEITVRWTDKTVLFRNAAGEEVMSDAIIHSSIDLELGGYIWRGALNDLTSSDQGDPLNVSEAREIRRFDKTESVDGTLYNRKTYL